MWWMITNGNVSRFQAFVIVFTLSTCDPGIYAVGRFYIADCHIMVITSYDFQNKLSIASDYEVIGSDTKSLEYRIEYSQVIDFE